MKKHRWLRRVAAAVLSLTVAGSMMPQGITALAEQDMAEYAMAAEEIRGGWG